MSKLDKKDKKILKELEVDARALIRDIAKKTRIPRDSVKYRIDRMKKNGVIKGYSPICDTNVMGYPVYAWVHLTLQNFNKDIEKKFKAFLSSHNNIIYVARVTGKYHYVFTCATKTIEDFDNVLRQIMQQYGNIIKEYNTSLMIEEVKYDSFSQLIE